MLNALMRLVNAIRRLYWWLVRPKTRGVRGIVLNDHGEILLARHRYLKGWYLPGGKVGRKEDAPTALQREIQEETGIKGALVGHLVGTYTSEQEYKRDSIEVFFVRVSDSLSQRLDLEVEDARFFPIDSLPSDISPATQRRIAEYRQELPISAAW